MKRAFVVFFLLIIFNVRPSTGVFSHKKIYCYKCIRNNGNMCETRFSEKVHCSSNPYAAFGCYKRQYTIDGVLHTERGCMRRDFYNSNWPCFENLQNCQTSYCTTSLCNSSVSQKTSFSLSIFCLSIIFLITWSCY